MAGEIKEINQRGTECLNMETLYFLIVYKQTENWMREHIIKKERENSETSRLADLFDLSLYGQIQKKKKKNNNTSNFPKK